MLQLHGTLLGQQPLHLLVVMADKDLLLNVLFWYGVELLHVIFKVYPFTVCPHHEPLPHHTITQGTTMLADFSDQSEQTRSEFPPVAGSMQYKRFMADTDIPNKAHEVCNICQITGILTQTTNNTITRMHWLYPLPLLIAVELEALYLSECQL